ncbi:MAG: hypothetical protein RL632_628 [Bacteroidota bacterium]
MKQFKKRARRSAGAEKNRVEFQRSRSSLSLCFVEKMGLEPTTPWLPAKCSSQLSYIPGCVKDNGLD